VRDIRAAAGAVGAPVELGDDQDVQIAAAGQGVQRYSAISQLSALLLFASGSTPSAHTTTPTIGATAADTRATGLCLSHLSLAHQQARRFALRHRLAYDDVLGAAYEGLCKAALGFDPSLGHRPSSYVVPKVKGELLHHLRDTGFALRICHRYRELWIKARRLVAQGRSDREIAEAMGVSVEVWVDVRLACGLAPLSLELVCREG
jgi:RNA polymerase sigma-B factor